MRKYDSDLNTRLLPDIAILACAPAFCVNHAPSHFTAFIWTLTWHPNHHQFTLEMASDASGKNRVAQARLRNLKPPSGLRPSLSKNQEWANFEACALALYQIVMDITLS